MDQRGQACVIGVIDHSLTPPPDHPQVAHVVTKPLFSLPAQRRVHAGFIRNSVQQSGIMSVSFFVVAGGYSHVCLYEKVAWKSTSAEPPRWATGTGQSNRLRFRAGTIARRGGGMISFSIFVVAAVTAMYVIIKPRNALHYFHASLGLDQAQNKVRPWRLYGSTQSHTNEKNPRPHQQLKHNISHAHEHLGIRQELTRLRNKSGKSGE